MNVITTIAEIVINMYKQTTVPSRFAYIFWSMLILIYVYTNIYERLHGLSLSGLRTKTQFNNPFTLYILGAAAIAVHHLTLKFETAWRLPLNASKIGFVGWFIMAGGLAVVCLGRASMNGYWAPDIYDYGTKNKLITNGIYTRTRHPVYDGQFLMTVGTIMMTDNLWLVFLPLLTLFANLVRARREDKDLEKRFPAEFGPYKKRTAFFMGIM